MKDAIPFGVIGFPILIRHALTSSNIEWKCSPEVAQWAMMGDILGPLPLQSSLGRVRVRLWIEKTGTQNTKEMQPLTSRSLELASFNRHGPPISVSYNQKCRRELESTAAVAA